MFAAKNGRTAQGRLHPSTLVSPHMAALICRLAVIAAYKEVAWISVTTRILKSTEEMVMEDAPAEVRPSVQERLSKIRKKFKPIGLLSDSSGVWIGGDRLRYSQPGDNEAVEAALEHGDDFIVTLNPRSLPRYLSEDLGTEVVTPAELFEAAQEQIPELMRQAMEGHRRAMEFTTELYKDYLHSAGLVHLIPLMPAAS